MKKIAYFIVLFIILAITCILSFKYIEPFDTCYTDNIDAMDNSKLSCYSPSFNYEGNFDEVLPIEFNDKTNPELDYIKNQNAGYFK